MESTPLAHPATTPALLAMRDLALTAILAHLFAPLQCLTVAPANQAITKQAEFALPVRSSAIPAAFFPQTVPPAHLPAISQTTNVFACRDTISTVSLANCVTCAASGAQ
jgi:hypothetical protein